MAMILDAFMSNFSELLVQMVRDEVGTLLGAPGEIEKLQRTVSDIQCLIADAEKRQTESMLIRRWLVELKDVMYDADDIMDLCQIKAEERRERSDMSAPAREIGTKIKEINSRLEEIAKRKSDLGLIAMQTGVGPQPFCRVESVISRKTDSLVVMEDLVGEKIEEDAELLVSWLTGEESGVTGRSIGVAAIVGMGGIGKTTLAKRIFNDSKIKEEFELKIWVCVSKEVKATELLKCIIQGAGSEPGAAQERSELVPELENVIQGKKFFLVLDDVWFESVRVWDDLLLTPMRGGAHGSRLLVTTRDERVAQDVKATKSHQVGRMSDEDGWSLLVKQIFENEDSEIQGFKDVGLKLVEKCDGLPLAIKSVGGLLCMKSKTIAEWQALLENSAWSMDGLPDDIHQAFYLSYEDLPSHLKQCFIFCSLYPEGHLFAQKNLIYLWSTEGFLQGNRSPLELGTEYYKELLLRNLLENEFYDDKSHCKMHDLLRSFAHYLGNGENYILTEEKILNRSEYFAKLRRLSIQKNIVNLQVVKKEKGLRTLVFINGISENALVDLSTSFSNLRILDMSFSNVSTLPDSLASLVHLRYLDVGGSEVRTIPESIGCLRNLVYLDISYCEELEHVPHSITNLVKLMHLSLGKTKVEGIPTGLKKLVKLQELWGFRPSKNSVEMFSSLDELETLSHLVALHLECLERVNDKNIAKGAKLWCKNQLQDLILEYTELSWEDQLSQTNEKETIEGVLNELCPPTSAQCLEISGYFGSTLPYWLKLGNAFPNLRDLAIRNCHCFVHLAPLGQLPNLDFLWIEGAYSITSIGCEFLWGDAKTRDTNTTGSCSVVPAFPKLNKLMFEGMANWKEWRWNKGESAMPKLKKLFIQGCPLLRSLPEGLVHHATSLEFLDIDGAHDLTTIEHFPSINDFSVFRNHSLERISNVSRISYLLIQDCPTLKIMENLNALQRMRLLDSEMETLPEYLMAVTPQKLRIDCSEELLQKITSQGESGTEWQKFKHIPRVTIYSWDGSCYPTNQKMPFSFTTNIRA